MDINCILHTLHFLILTLVTGSLHLLISFFFLFPLPTLFPSGNHLFVLSIYNSWAFVVLVLCLFLIFPYKEIMQYLSLSDLFHLHNALLVYLCCCKRQDFILFFMANSPLCMYIYIFLIHSATVEDLDCFHILTTVNNATVNIGVCISFLT